MWSVPKRINRKLEAQWKKDASNSSRKLKLMTNNSPGWRSHWQHIEKKKSHSFNVFLVWNPSKKKFAAQPTSKMGLGFPPPPRLSEVDTSAERNREREKKKQPQVNGVPLPLPGWTWRVAQRKDNETRRRLIKGWGEKRGESVLILCFL